MSLPSSLKLAVELRALAMVMDEVNPPVAETARNSARQLEALQAEIEGLESTLRVNVWNNCMREGIGDDAAYRLINATIEGIKTQARASLSQGEE